MRYPNAIWHPGPKNKQNGGTNTCRGAVLHSMVGPYSAALGELEKASRRASWHYSVLKDGRVFCHYEDEAQCWHAGSGYNNSTIGIEHEGGLRPHNEPLTPEQRGASVALVRWLSEAHVFPMERHNGLWEHNEVSGEPTACPSNRIPWDCYTPEEEEMKSFLCWDSTNKRIYFVGPDGPKWITQQGVVDELAKEFGPLNVALSWPTLQALGAR